jgi:ATP-dependent DNA helicase UvrD/PcrA
MPEPELDPEQRKAVEHTEGPLLVIAGPGSGKTGVITRRIIGLLEAVPGLRPENILALTYTDKAAGEMKARIAQRLPGPAPGPHISTFHSYCNHLLRERDFDRQLLDQTDVWIFLRQRIEQLELDFYQKLAEPGAFLHDLNNFFSRCQDELVGPEQYEAYVHDAERRFLARAATLAPAERELEEQNLRKLQEVSRVFRKSREMLMASGRSSFGSLFSETLRLWDSEPDALDFERQRYRYILVDEFQDTNYAQIEILKRLAVAPFNVTAVGDDDQAIYRFRGASSGAFHLFREAFPRRTELFLFRNYRSTKRILCAAGVLIRRNEHALGNKPALQTANPDGPRLFLLQVQDAASEAAWIAGEVSRLLGKGTLGSHIAVLYRAHAHRERLVEELARRQIPISIRGLSVLSSPILRDLVAYLQLISSPHENVSLTRVLLAPRWKFPEELAMAAREEASRERCSLFDALESFEKGADVSIVSTGWRELKDLLEKLRRAAKRTPMSELLDLLVAELGLVFLPGGDDRALINTFRNFLEKWEKKSETRRLREFMEYFRYFAEAGGKIERTSPADPAAVQLMTVHAAKGLEFPVVFILSVSPQRFPHREQKPLIEFPDELRNAPVPDEDIHLQEERRLFYVAMTRAKKRLVVSSISRVGKKRSIFIEDLLSDAGVRAREIEEISVPLAEETTTSRKPARQAASFKAGQNLFHGTPGPETVHPDLAGWAARPPAAPLNGQLQLSASGVEDYLTCPLKYKFGHLLKIPTGPQAALTFGSVMHRSVRRYFELRRAHIPTFEEMKEYFESVWKSAGYEDSYQEETYRRAGLAQLHEFVALQNARPLEAGGIELEKGFRLELGDILLEGRIDQINPVGDHQVELVDYKTGRPRPASEAGKSLQLSVYALAARRELKLEPVRLSLYYLSNNQTVSTVRSPKQLDETVEKIREVAGQIRARRFQPSPGFACKWCDYVPICPAHEESS